MSILTRVKVNLVNHVITTSEYDGNPESMCEANFVVYTSSCSLLAMREVGYKKPRSPNFCDYGIIDLVDCRITVDSLRLESAVLNRRSDSFIVYTDRESSNHIATKA